ncbi:putative ATPase, AAA+ superfamily [Carboxydocella thermautotrophica]|nr:putative ATPase, AAA+ superfamily [Carboxydocella thermautotrophica]
MLQTVKDACTLQENALEIRVSDQIENLDELVKAEGDGRAFFERTHITQGMRTLIVEGIARLAGKSNQAIFHLKQAMGGGKTHLLIGLGLLAMHPELRKEVCSDVLYAGSFGVAKVAAFNGRNTPQEFFWGEIAQQLGKAELFRDFWVAGPKAPDEKDWLKLFDGGEPILILLDEMPPYFHYLDTQKVGNGTVADIATRAFANMLTAAGKKSNVCVVVSDLAASYDSGTRLISRALEDARQELGRQERNITPVDLAGNEVYDILRKRLFKKLPDRSTIEEIASLYGRVLEEATKAKVANRGAEAIADEIVNTYPFHPRLKNLVALFKENEKFKQTRGLLELVSRLLKSVWERKSNDVFLIGPQHFDLSIPEVREKLAEISEMRDVIAKDLWDVNAAAHAQLIDLSSGSDAAAQVGALLLTASLSTAVNAVKGLTKEEMVECLTTPLRSPSEFLSAFEALETSAWYLHHTPEGRYYFDRQENLTKLLQSLANDAPEPKVEELIRFRLNEMFKPIRKTVYDEVLPLPKLDEVADKVRKARVLLIVSPDSKLPPEEVRRFFESLMQKNNICVLTGDKTHMGSVEKAARQVFAAKQADSRIPPGHPQREELERKQQQYEQDFTATILGLFDKVFFPIQRPGKPPQLVNKPLDMTRDATKPFNGEEQIEKTLTKDPLKLYLDVEANFDAIRDKAETLLWPENQDEARWSDILDRMAEQAGMPWLPPKGLEQLKGLACNRGLWEDLGNGYITKKPQKKKTSVQVIPETEPDDEGFVRLRVNPQNAGPAPRIHYAEDAEVSTQSPVLSDQFLKTNALRVRFLVVDPSNQYETGEPVIWENKLVIRNRLFEEGGKRKVELLVAPKGKLRYTLDGSEPREGTTYTGPFEIGDGDTLVRAFAECDGLEAKSEFRFPARGQKGVLVDDVKPAQIVNLKKLDSRNKTFSGLKEAKEKGICFENVTLTVGQGARAVQVMVGEIKVTADYIESILTTVLNQFDSATPVTMSFRKAHFASGHDLKRFAEALGIEIQQGEVIQ